MAGYTSVHISGLESADEAERHVSDEAFGRKVEGNTTRHFKANNLDAMIKVFDTLRKEKAQVDYLDIHAHGSAGVIHLVNERIDIDAFRSHVRGVGRGYDNVFVPGAKIRFLSCEFAGSADGELLLAEFGQLLLRQGGGTLQAASGYCLVKPSLLFADTYKNTGRWVTATISPGGGVRLSGHYFLNPARILLTAHALLALLTGELQRGGSSSRAESNAVNTVDDLVARGLAMKREELARQREVWAVRYGKWIDKLRIAVRKVQGKPSLKELGEASDHVEAVAESLTADGVPLTEVARPLVGILSAGK